MRTVHIKVNLGLYGVFFNPDLTYMVLPKEIIGKDIPKVARSNYRQESLGISRVGEIKFGAKIFVLVCHQIVQRAK